MGRARVYVCVCVCVCGHPGTLCKSASRKGRPRTHTIAHKHTARRSQATRVRIFLTREEAINTMASVAVPLAAPAPAPAPAAAAAVAGGGAVAPVVTSSVKATVAVPAVAVPVVVPGAVPRRGGRGGGKSVHEGGGVRALSCPAVSHHYSSRPHRGRVFSQYSFPNW